MSKGGQKASIYLKKSTVKLLKLVGVFCKVSGYTGYSKVNFWIQGFSLGWWESSRHGQWW